MTMQTSYFLAQLLGLTTALFAVAAFFRPQFVRAVTAELEDSALFQLLFGFIALVSGLAIVLTHNLWVNDWRVVITIIGWGGILKGFSTVAMPHTLVSLGSIFYGSDGKTRVVLVIAGALGLYLAGIGFGYF